MFNKRSPCEVSALKKKNTIEHDGNSFLGFKNYYSTLAENLVNMLPKHSINALLTVKYYEHMTQGSHFNLASVFENSILTILKST